MSETVHNQDSLIYDQIIAPGHTDISEIIGPNELDQLIPIPVSTGPIQALGGRERRIYAINLRASALHSIQVANRLNPESADTVVLLEKDTMAAISTRWQKLQQGLQDMAGTISKLNEEAKAKDLMVADLQQKLDDVSKKASEQEIKLQAIRTSLGDLPDVEDAAAIKEMDAWITGNVKTS